MFDAFLQELYINIIAKNRFSLYLEGLGNTIIIALGATLIGIIIGMIIAIIKVYADYPKRNIVLSLLNRLCNLYLAVIRGTPMVVQLLIMYYVVFGAAPSTFRIPVAILSFGINSGAYVAEIIRAGIQSIDHGQMEAGRSLGLSQNMTMRYIVLPQAIKNTLPPLFNEFIVLIKETAIVSLIAVRDLTMASTNVRAQTYAPFVPLIFVALIYLCMVLGLSSVQKRIERRLRQSDRH